MGGFGGGVGGPKREGWECGVSWKSVVTLLIAFWESDYFDHNYRIRVFLDSMWVFQTHSEDIAAVENSLSGQCLDVLKRQNNTGAC